MRHCLHQPSKEGRYLFWVESLEGRENLLIKESLTLNGLERGMIPQPELEGGVSQPRGRG